MKGKKHMNKSQKYIQKDRKTETRKTLKKESKAAINNTIKKSKLKQEKTSPKDKISQWIWKERRNYVTQRRHTYKQKSMHKEGHPLISNYQSLIINKSRAEERHK